MKLAARRGSAPRSTARRRSGSRASTRSTITLSSRRASWLPRQKWAPKPNAIWGFGLRVMSKVSASLEDVLVAVGRWVQEDELLAGLDLRPAQFHIARGDAGHVLDRRDPAQHLLHCTRHQPGGVSGQLRHLVGVGEELLHAAADDMAGRLVAPDQDEQRLVDERPVVQRVAVDLGVAQHADEVVAVAGCPPILEHGMDVVRVLREGVGRVDHGVGVGRALALEHVVGPLAGGRRGRRGRRRACRRS